MLDILRKKSSTFAVYFVFAILIVIFAVGFGAVAPDQACGGGAPGTFKNVDFVDVDGETIDAALVRTGMQLTGDAADPKRGFADPNDRFVYQTRFAYMNLYGPFSGGAFGPDPARISPIKLTKVVDDLIETKLVANWARSMGIGISKGELNDALALLLSNDSFRNSTTGAIEINAYRNWVTRSLETTVAGFEKLVEEELLRERVIQLLVGEIGVSDAEIEQAYRLENDKVTVEVVSFDARSAAPLVPVTDAEVAEWLGKNEEKAKAEYERLKTSKYTTPKQWKLRGIRINAPDLAMTEDPEQKKAFEEERNAAKARAEKVLADFKARLSAPPAAPEDAPADPEAAPAPAAVDPLAVFGELAKANSEDASKDEGGSLAPASLDVLAAAPFGPAVQAAAASMKIGEATDVIEVGGGFWIFMPEAISEEKVDLYEAVKNEIAKRLVQTDKASDFAKTLADEALAEAKKDPTKKLGEVVTALNAKYGATDGGLEASQSSFSRLSRLAAGYPASSPYLMELGGRAPELVSAAFAASAEKPLLDRVFPVGDKGRLVIARFIELKAAEAQKDEDKDSLRAQLEADLRRAVYRGWYEDLLAKKLAAGDVEFTSAFEEERKAAEAAFVEAGGVLPGPGGTAAAPAPAKAVIPVPAPAPTPAPAPAPTPAP